MRLACTSKTKGEPVVQMPSVSLLMLLALHSANHQPQLSYAAQLSVVIVAVWSTEHLSVGLQIILGRYNHQGVAGVSAVSGHRQLILTNLITDGERRVLSRVPQTRSTLDLLTDTRNVETCYVAYFCLQESDFYHKYNKGGASRRQLNIERWQKPF